MAVAPLTPPLSRFIYSTDQFLGLNDRLVMECDRHLVNVKNLAVPTRDQTQLARLELLRVHAGIPLGGEALGPS